MIRTSMRMKLCIALLIAILVFIWGNSLMPASVSSLFSDWVQNLLMGGKPAGGGETDSGVLRKVAHFTEFAALGMCLGWLFGMLQKGRVRPFFWGAAAACLDEALQAFAPGRAPGAADVLLDSCGVLTGIILLYLGHSYCKKKSTNQSLEDK